jgi:hypothetical protein
MRAAPRQAIPAAHLEAALLRRRGVVEEHGDRLPLPRKGGCLEGRSAGLESHAREVSLSLTACCFCRSSYHLIPSLPVLVIVACRVMQPTKDQGDVC